MQLLYHCNVVVQLGSLSTALGMSGVLKVLPDQDLEKLIRTSYLDSTSSSFSSLSSLPWLATTSSIATAVLQPLSGWLTDIRGRRAELISSNATFGGGNLICGLATFEAVLLVRGNNCRPWRR